MPIPVLRTSDHVHYVIKPTPMSWTSKLIPATESINLLIEGNGEADVLIVPLGDGGYWRIDTSSDST